MHYQKTRARSLRQQIHVIESSFWYRVRNQRLGVKFRRQHPIGPYVVDFVCLEIKLVVELDGSGHAEREVYDAKRTEYLLAQGFQVIRFWNNDVISSLEDVLESICRIIAEHKAR